MKTYKAFNWLLQFYVINIDKPGGADGFHVETVGFHAETVPGITDFYAKTFHNMIRKAYHWHKPAKSFDITKDKNVIVGVYDRLEGMISGKTNINNYVELLLMNSIYTVSICNTYDGLVNISLFESRSGEFIVCFSKSSLIKAIKEAAKWTRLSMQEQIGYGIYKRN